MINYFSKINGNERLKHAVLLFLASFLSLFLEMLIIRWLSTEVRIFAHLKNLALIACFAGLGLGYAIRHWRIPIWFSIVGMMILVIASQSSYVAGNLTLKNLSKMISFDNIYSWHPIANYGTMALGMLLFIGVFTIVVFMFVPIGQFLGDLFRSSKNILKDYTLNVIASVLGILAFTALCVVNTPPVVWFLLGLLPLIFLMPDLSSKVIGIVALVVIIFSTLPLAGKNNGIIETTWSPYQKIQVWRVEAKPSTERGWTIYPAPQPAGGYPMYMLDVNDIAMMWILDMSTETLNKNPWLKTSGKIEWYDFPYRILPCPENVLVVGSGSGNDVAAALRHGAKHIDAVEIDPVIVKMGLKYNAEKPYQNPCTNVTVTDARRYFQTCKKKYDVIVFGQLDNTDYNLMSNFSNIRMDSYIYTSESFRSAYRLLKKNGIMVVNFGSNDWWGNRMTHLLEESVGQKPLGFYNQLQLHFEGRENTYISGNLSLVKESASKDPDLRNWIQKYKAAWTENKNDPKLSDDWPYWFLSRRAIPSLHIVVMVFILVISIVLVKICLPKTSVINGHFFFLGAAFMLLEVHLICKTALLYGSTWMVNAGVISGILVMTVAANILVLYKGSINRSWIYIVLAATLAIQWLVPPSRFLDMQQTLSVTTAMALYCLPVFFSAMIFALSFKESSAPDLALGSNLLGCICGGLLESFSYIFGMHFLVGLTIMLYGFSAIFLYFKRQLPGK